MLRQALERLTISGESLGGKNLADAVIDPPSLSLSITQTSQVTVKVSDPDLVLLRDGLLAPRAVVNLDGNIFQIAAVEVSGGLRPEVAVKARNAGTLRLKEETGAKTFSDVSPTTIVRESAESVGMGFVGEDTAVRGSLTRPGADERQEAQSQWDFMRDLAAQEGFLLFDADNVIYFARPTWLVDNAEQRWSLRFPSPARVGADQLVCIGVPGCRKSLNDENEAASISVNVPWEVGLSVRPGDAVEFEGVPGFEGAYIVSEVDLMLDGRSTVSLNLTTPVDPDPRPQDTDGAALGLEGGEFPANDFAPVFPEAELLPRGPLNDNTTYFVWPTRGVLTSRFGQRNGRLHKGIDIGGNDGEPIWAGAAGIVTVAAFSESYGWWVEIDHDLSSRTYPGASASAFLNHSPSQSGAGEFRTRYAHMRSRPTVSVGDLVEQRQVIGYVGNTGRSTGPHLHFEVRRRDNGGARNPEFYLGGRLRGVIPQREFVIPGSGGVVS